MKVDLNADVGESFGAWALGDDVGLLPHLTSANVACGFHAGDPRTLAATCRTAVAHGVTIGAQVGYHDLSGFGRRFIDVDPEELRVEIIYQVGALDALARTSGGGVRYVKPHGALYNAVVHHEPQARAVVDALVSLGGHLPVVGLPGSALLRLAADAGLSTVAEAFVDRAYAADGTLVPRGTPGAVLTDIDDIVARAVRMVTHGVVRTRDGNEIGTDAQSLCVHGDTPGAVELARRVRSALADAGVDVRPFAPS